MNNQQSIQATKSILIYAMRYALGRKTPAPSDVTESIVLNLDKFNMWELELIKKEIDEYGRLHNNNFGHDCDYDTWYDFYYTIINEMNERMK